VAVSADSPSPDAVKAEEKMKREGYLFENKEQMQKRTLVKGGKENEISGELAKISCFLSPLLLFVVFKEPLLPFLILSERVLKQAKRAVLWKKRKQERKKKKKKKNMENSALISLFKDLARQPFPKLSEHFRNFPEQIHPFLFFVYTDKDIIRSFEGKEEKFAHLAFVFDCFFWLATSGRTSAELPMSFLMSLKESIKVSFTCGHVWSKGEMIASCKVKQKKKRIQFFFLFFPSFSHSLLPRTAKWTQHGKFSFLSSKWGKVFLTDQKKSQKIAPFAWIVFKRLTTKDTIIPFASRMEVFAIVGTLRFVIFFFLCVEIIH
jgi:hypothetical protein